MGARRKKQPSPMAPTTPPVPLPEFCEGALWALRQLGEVLWERRQGMWKLERALKSAPPEDQQAIADVLEPLGGGVQDNVLATVKRRLEDRITAECQRRMEPNPAAREEEGA